MTKTMLSSEEQKPYIHAFNLTQSIGPKTFEKIGSCFADDFKKAWHARSSDFTHADISEHAVRSIISKRDDIDPERAYEQLKQKSISAITKDDAEYPLLLKEIPTAPAMLYVRGSLIPDELSIAVVGTRRPTSYGTEACETLTRDLARSGITIVSGLALGIDGTAHRTCVDANTRTVAVLGSGCDDDSIYPDYHKPLARTIIGAGGAVISEFPPATPGFKQNFPQRNRIIAGLAKGTLVIEAKEKSGALITARYALEYGRDVFAVPGSIFSMASEGSNILLKEGAAPVTTARDILKAYNLDAKEAARAAKEQLHGLEADIVALLDAPLSFEYLCQRLNIQASMLNSTLSMLELKSHIKNIGNRTYRRNN